MEKKKVLEAIKLLPIYKYSCNALKNSGVNNETVELYRQFLTSHYPMFFIGDEIFGVRYVRELDIELFNPRENSRDIRIIFLKQFAEYL